MFQFQKQKINIKESQNMSKSHNVCFLNDLFLISYFPCFLFVFSNLKCCGCAKLIFMLIIWTPNVKEQQKKVMKKMNVMTL